MTTMRQTIAAALQAELGFPFVDGRLEGAQNMNLGCTFPIGIEEGDENVATETLTVAVRLFQKRIDVTDPEHPFNPRYLEDWAERAQQAMIAIQTSAGPWFIRPVAVAYDMDQQGVEITVTGWGWNGCDP